MKKLKKAVLAVLSAVLVVGNINHYNFRIQLYPIRLKNRRKRVGGN